MAIIGGDQGKAGESKGSGRKADDLRLSCLCLLLALRGTCQGWQTLSCAILGEPRLSRNNWKPATPLNAPTVSRIAKRPRTQPRPRLLVSGDATPGT